MNENNIKQILYIHCQQFVEQRISNAQVAINTAKESANDDTKSSAGDKHETGRAMAQLEQEKSAIQLNEAYELQNILQKINPHSFSEIIQNGSVVLTNKGNFFISIPAGKIVIENKVYFAISIGSPIGLNLKKKSKKMQFDFNGQLYEIEDIF
ncbi:MAG: 3-oxoacyl-ACP synthase [Bacteroidetes bacterium]|nr:3-oxoacyl-ACP synthase [Bacteroidota bacterium]